MRSQSTAFLGMRVQGRVLRISRTDAWAWGIALAGILVGASLARFDLRMYPGAIAVLGLAPVFLLLDRKTMPDLLFGPAVFMYLYHVMGYAVGPVGQIYVSNVLNLSVTEFESGLILAQWGAVSGLLTFAIVYQRVFRVVAARFPQGKLPGIAPERAWAGYGVLMLVAAVAIIAYGYSTGAGNRLARVEDVSVGVSTVYAAFQVIHQVMFFFLGFAAARLRGRWTMLWLAVFLTYSLFFFLDGGRGTVATAGLLSAVGWVAGGSAPRKILAVSMVAGIAFIPMSGVVNKYRDAFLGRPESFHERWSGFVEAVQDFSTDASAGEYGPSAAFLERITTFSVDRAFVLTPSVIPFAGWEGMGNIFYAFVPRVVLPGRPDLIDGNELAIRYGATPTGTTGNYMPAVGDGYRRFGWPGIVFLYAFSASLFSTVAAASYRLRARKEWMAMLIFITISASEIMISTLLSVFYTFLWTMPKYFVFFLFLRWFQEHINAVQNGLSHKVSRYPRIGRQ